MLIFIIFVNKNTNKNTIKTPFYILFFCLIFSLVSKAENQDAFYSNLIEKNSSETSKLLLEENFSRLEKLTKDSSSKNIQIIYKVLLANLIANEKNDLNTQSTTLYNEAINFVNNSNNLSLKIWTQSQAGFYFYRFYKYEEASKYFFNSSRMLEDNFDNNTIDPITVLKYNAYFFANIKDIELSNIILKEALKITPKTDINYAAFLNALGTNYFDLQDYKLAEMFYNEAIRLSKINKDWLRFAKALGDLAQIYSVKDKYIDAENLLLTDIRISKKLKNNQNTMFAQIRLGKLYVQVEEFDKAISVFNEASDYIKSNEKLRVYDLDVSLQLLKIYTEKKWSNKELLLRRKIDSLRPIVDTTNGAEALKKIALNSIKVKTDWKLKSEKNRAENENILKITFIVISLLLMFSVVLFVLLANRKLKLQRVDFENSLLKIEIEKMNSEKALEDANNSLENFKKFLYEKNDQIVILEKSLKELNTFDIVENKEASIKIENLLSSHLMTNDNWISFKNAIIKEEPDLYNSIITNFTNLSESNLRIILLNKIGLTNQEIANLLGITIHGVKKAKQRLRNKYGEAIDKFL